ncbi:MAG: nitronate monooxygenase [Acidobacteriaceae bacterium]|nr:nitronate monooxygenase [Acidobacteriaceae bacterium]
MTTNQYPVIIQGGMGAGVSDWRLANAVSRLGQLGVVSGTALDQILARRLQDGDPGGHMRRAMEAFPVPAMAERIWQKYYIEGGKAKTTSYAPVPVHEKDNSAESNELCIVSNFVEIFLAREGHENPVGINYLEKIQIAHLPSIFGAMLAGVGYILMGAGIPLKIPGILDRFAEMQPAEYPLAVIGAKENDDITMRFNPRDYVPEGVVDSLPRPLFLAIVASNTLAITVLKKSNGRVDGLIFETQAAGGHNAPPRGKMVLSEKGEPVYGERDVVDYAKVRELGVPFWLAGGYGTPEKLREALDLGATGVQVGTAFEMAEESGLREDYKRNLMARIMAGSAGVFTDPLVSPAGFPFKVAELEETVSDLEVFKARPRICDLGFLREAYRTEAGEIGFRCAAEPVSVFVSKGGKIEETEGRKCICNGLLANIGQPQARNGMRTEPGIVTAGDCLGETAMFLKPGSSTYTVEDVVTTLLKA